MQPLGLRPGKAIHPSGSAGTAHEPGDRPEREMADVPRGGGDGRGGFSFCSLRFYLGRGASMCWMACRMRGRMAATEGRFP